MTSHFVEVHQNIRPKIEALVELLVDLLDQIDGDVDPEDGSDNEPSLGSCENQRLGQTSWTQSGTDDREHDDAEHGVCDSDAADEFEQQREAIDAFLRNLEIKHSEPARYARGAFRKGYDRCATARNNLRLV